MDFRRLFGRWDVIAMVLVLAVAGATWYAMGMSAGGEATELRIIRLQPGGGSEVIETIPLPADLEEWIDGPSGGMALRVSGREVTVYHSECPQLICVETGHLKTAGDRSICVPNGIIVELISDEVPYDHILR